MPISLEQWRAAVGRWVARIQRTLIIRRGVKRSPPCASNQEWESSFGQSHSGERKCMGRRKGRKKYKEDPVNDPADASDELYDGVIVLGVPLMSCGTTVSKDCSDGNPAGSLKELFSWTALGAFLVIMLLLLISGDVEPNPGPAERGAHTLLSISSAPTLHEMDKLTVSHVASQWEEAAPHLMVESCGVCQFGSGHLQEASRGALSRWLKGESNTDIAEKTRCSVLEAQEANGNTPLAEQLKLFEESSGEAVTGHASPPGVSGTGRRQQYMSTTTAAAPLVRGLPPGDLRYGSVRTPFGSNEIHGPDGKIAQQGAHTLLSISSTPALHELNKLTVCHAASQWEVVAPHLVVEFCGVCKINGSGHPHETSRGALSRWLKDKSGTDIAEKTRCPVLEAPEANGNNPQAEQLKLFEESSGEAVTSLASLPEPAHTPFGSNEIHGPNGKLTQQGAHNLLSISSLPTLHELDKLTVCHAASQWEEVAPHLVVESCGVCNIIGSGHPEEASRGALSVWLKGESNTDIAEKTRCSVLEAQEASGNIPLAEHLKLFEGSSEKQVTGLASPTGPADTLFGGNEIHGPDGKLTQQGAHTLLNISSTPTLHESGKLTVDHVASQWEEVAPHLVAETCEVCNFGSGHLEEASRGALSRWLKGESDTDIAEKTKCSDLEAQEASGNIPLAEQLKLFEESTEKTVTDLASPTDSIRPSCQLSCDLLNELPHFDLIVDCLCCHFGEWMKAGPTRSDLSCPLSDEIPVTPLSPDWSAHLLSVKSNTTINASAGRMAALITFLLWQTALVALAFLLLFLLEVTAANLEKMKAWWKAGNNYISSQCKMRTFKSICVQCPLNLQMTVAAKYRYQAASQQLCGLLAKPYVFLRELLLLAGDIEANPGPIQVEEIIGEFREQFISDMDVNMIVMELLDKDVISDGVRESIERANGPRHRSEILHEHLKRTCTEEAFRTVCAIVASVRGNPKMSALGKGMQRSLESGVSSRGRHGVMAPLTSAAAHGSVQSNR